MTDAPLMSLTFTLPWPPSVNHYWQHIVLGGRFKKSRVMVFLSDAGKRYRKEALATLVQQRVPRGALKGRLAVDIIAYPPDRRGKRDLDNLWKGMLDSLVHAGVIADDGDFDHECVDRGPIVAGGRIELKVREIGVFNDQAALFAPEDQKILDAFASTATNVKPQALTVEKLVRAKAILSGDKPPF